MKLYSNRADGFVRDLKTNTVLIYGNDQGAVAELGKKIAKRFMPNPDPMAVVDFDMDRVKEDEGSMLDEISSMSFFSAQKLIIIRDATDSLSKLLDKVLPNLNKDTFLLIMAGELNKGSGLRKIYEDSQTLTALLCYKDDEASLKRHISDRFREKGIRADQDATEYLSANLGDDKMVTNNEIDKILLYLGEEKHLKLEDVENLLADNNEAQMMDLAFAVTARDFKRTEKLLANIFSQHLNAVSVFRILAWHLQRLAMAKSAIESGTPADSALNQLRPQVFFKQAPAFRAALNNWDKNKLMQALQAVNKAELDAKKSILDEEVLCSKVLLNLARL